MADLSDIERYLQDKLEKDDLTHLLLMIEREIDEADTKSYWEGVSFGESS